MHTENKQGMTRAAIQSAVGRKVDDWLGSISDAELRAAVGPAVIVTGGCLASMLVGEPVNDYDIYLEDRGVLERLMKYYCRQYAENPPPRFRSGEAVRIYVDNSGEYPQVVVKSAGIAGESETPPYEYFETRPDGAAEDYVRAAVGDINVVDGDADDVVDDVLDAVDGEQPKSRGPGAKEKNRYRVRFLTSNAVTLTDRVQIVSRFFGGPADVHRNFDFVHCTNYYRHADRRLYLRAEALESLLARRLRYVGSLYPMCSLFRLRKFISRGWNISAADIVKIAVQVNALDLTDLKVWRDQLIGVDTAYFQDLVARLTADRDGGQTVDGNYVIKILDEIGGVPGYC